MALDASSWVKPSTAKRSVPISQKSRFSQEPDPNQARQAVAPLLFCLQISKLRAEWEGREVVGSAAPSRKRAKASRRRPVSRTSVSREKKREVWGYGREAEGRADA